jgi:ubiquinone/menaquinone biosynthesis C-methylase UbiE
VVATLPQWEDFWRSGRIASCPTDATDRYSGNVRNGWEKFFTALPPGARLLDVGTGNGALPLIAVEAARGRSAPLEVHGVDLARIDPRRVVPDAERLFGNTVFHGGVAAEAMPFADGYFHAVAGQYSLEYTQREASLHEIHRVMAASASARFVLHHGSSIVVTIARESLSHAHELEVGAEAFTDLREYVAAERRDPERAARVHARIAERIQRMHGLKAQSKGSRLLDDMLPALGKLFELRQRLSPGEFEQAVDRSYRAFKAGEQRLREMIDVALDEPAMQRVAEQALAAGFSDVRFAPLIQDGDFLVGWQLDMTSASAADQPSSPARPL